MSSCQSERKVVTHNSEWFASSSYKKRSFKFWSYSIHISENFFYESIARISYLSSDKKNKPKSYFFRWWCHFDDDNYVHVLRLSHLLESYSAERPVYLGKPSTARPIEIWDLNAPQVHCSLHIDAVSYMKSRSDFYLCACDFTNFLKEDF